MNKKTNVLSILKFRISDLFLLIGFGSITVFLMFGQEYMQHSNPSDLPLNLEIIIPLFILLCLSWGIYIFLECKNGVFINKYVAAIFVILTFIAIFGIAIQPKQFEILMVKSDGETTLVGFEISVFHYVFFTFEIISILLFVFIGIFVFPKRFTNINFLRVIGYLVIAGCLALIIYSYIAEHNNYKPFIDSMIDGDKWKMMEYATKSFIIHKNAFGMTLLIGIIICFINHSIEKRWWYFILAIFFYINMIFTFCKTSLIITPIISLIYVYYVLISTFKKRKRVNLALLVIFSISLLFVCALFAVAYISQGKHLSFIHTILKLFFDNKTIDTREYIWNNVYQLMSQSLPTSIFFGRGFGLINEMLLPMNIENGDNPLTFPTHNGYLNLFAEGGFLYLFAYLALFGYSFYIVIKCLKKNPSTTLAIALGLFSFVFYSLIETIHYLTYVFMFVLFAFYNCQTKQQTANN